MLILAWTLAGWEYGEKRRDLFKLQFFESHKKAVALASDFFLLKILESQRIQVISAAGLIGTVPRGTSTLYFLSVSLILK